MSSQVINPLSLEGRRILVTGASSGIGKAIAVLFSQLGATIVVNGRNAARLREVTDSLHGDGHVIAVGDIATDIGRSDICDACATLDGVVHCAGIASKVVCKAIEASDLDSIFSTNVFGPILLQKDLLSAKCIKKGASIVFISSISNRYPSVGNGVYSASKGAILSYAKVLALELSNRKIRVNTISPAMVNTDLISSMCIGSEEMQRDMSNYKLGRYGEPVDVANLAAFLCSDASRWMTGSNIEITGGLIC